MKKLYVLLLALCVFSNSYGMFEEVKEFGKSLCESTYSTGETAIWHHSSIIAPCVGWVGGYLVGLACFDSDAACSNSANVGLLLGVNIPFARGGYQDYKNRTQVHMKRSKWIGMVAGKALVFTTMFVGSVGAYLKWCK